MASPIIITVADHMISDYSLLTGSYYFSPNLSFTSSHITAQVGDTIDITISSPAAGDDTSPWTVIYANASQDGANYVCIPEASAHLKKMATKGVLKGSLKTMIQRLVSPITVATVDTDIVYDQYIVTSDKSISYHLSHMMRDPYTWFISPDGQLTVCDITRPLMTHDDAYLSVIDITDGIVHGIAQAILPPLYQVDDATMVGKWRHTQNRVTGYVIDSYG